MVPKPCRSHVPDFRAWIREHGRCVVCRSRNVDPHHVRSRGAGGGDRENIVPLCRLHHDEVGRLGRPSFEAKYRVELRAVAGLTWRIYRHEVLWRRLPF